MIAIALVTLGLGRLRAAAPEVDRSGLWIGAVQRGEMVRQVKGTGSLVPEEIRWVTAGAQAEAAYSLFKLSEGGEAALRERVELGRASVGAIEVRAGLREGDRVFLSDMSRWDGVDRIQ